MKNHNRSSHAFSLGRGLFFGGPGAKTAAPFFVQTGEEESKKEKDKSKKCDLMYLNFLNHSSVITFNFFLFTFNFPQGGRA